MPASLARGCHKMGLLLASTMLSPDDPVWVPPDLKIYGRAARQSCLAGTDMLAVGDLVDVEEVLEHDEDDGVKLEPFNLARERQEGDFDEGGNYVERREEEDPTATDAWLTSEDGAALLVGLSMKEVERLLKHSRACHTWYCNRQVIVPVCMMHEELL